MTSFCFKVCYFFLIASAFTEKSTAVSEAKDEYFPPMNESNKLFDDDKVYYFGLDFKADFMTAMQFCRFNGMHLLSIESDEENNRIRLFLDDLSPTKRRDFWTSGLKVVKTNDVIWLSTGSVAKYTKWMRGQPDQAASANRRCLGIDYNFNKTIFWYDYKCTHEDYFICECKGYKKDNKPLDSFSFDVPAV